MEPTRFSWFGLDWVPHTSPYISPFFPLPLPVIPSFSFCLFLLCKFSPFEGPHPFYLYPMRPVYFAILPTMCCSAHSSTELPVGMSPPAISLPRGFPLSEAAQGVVASGAKNKGGWIPHSSALHLPCPLPSPPGLFLFLLSLVRELQGERGQVPFFLLLPARLL